MDSMQCSSLDAFSERISEMCACERAEISSSDNLHYAREHGNSPLYQYFVHGGPNHLWRNRPEVRDFLKRYGCILLPDNEAYMELQRAFALSPRSRKTFLKAQQSSLLPNLNPTDDDLLMHFITTGGGSWFSKLFVFPERVAMLIERERKLGFPKRGF